MTGWLTDPSRPADRVKAGSRRGGLARGELEDRAQPQAGSLLLLVGGVGAVVSLAARWRRADGVARQQLRLLTFGALLAVAGLVLDAMGWPAVALLSAPAIPVVATLAILRYRLYDIDRFISRTVTYLALTVVLGAIYAVGVTSLGAVSSASKPATMRARS